MNLGPEKGLVFSCDDRGIVREVLRDDFWNGARFGEGSAIETIVDPDNLEKARNFLASLVEQRAVLNWEINVPFEGTIVTLHFGGARLDDGFVVIAAQTRSQLSRLNDELMGIAAEQANALRAAAKKLALMRASGDDTHSDVAMFEEITKVNNDLVNLQRELAQKNAMLRALNEQKNRFLGMAAHDLRNPLGIIMSYASFLETEAVTLTAQQREFVTRIRQTSEFMLDLVTDLLDVSAIESGKLKLEREPTDLAALIQKNAELNRVLAKAKNIRVELGPMPALPIVEIDAGKIEQVLNNLLNNAVKFSAEGTRVIVSADVRDDAIEVAVEDEGQGIPEAEQGKLFKPFGVTRVRGTAGEPSTGLGLAIARRIMEGHGGRIGVDSTVGRGSRFTFSIPVEKELTKRPSS